MFKLVVIWYQIEVFWFRCGLLVLNLFDTFPYSHFDQVLKRRYPYCIMKTSSPWRDPLLITSKLGLMTERRMEQRVWFMIHISMDSSVWSHSPTTEFSVCPLNQKKQRCDLCLLRDFFPWSPGADELEMEDVRDPSTEAQLWCFPGISDCRCFSKHSSSVNELTCVDFWVWINVIICI